LEGSKSLTLPKLGKDPKFHKIYIPLASCLLEKVILQIDKRHIEEKGLLNASKFGVLDHHIMAIQCMRLTDHVNLKFQQ
jgi:hypothetical protein